MEYLLLLSLRNVRCESSHISKLHAKFGENLLQIADYIIPEITFWRCLVISPNFFCARAHCGFTLIFQVSSKSVQVWGTNNQKTARDLPKWKQGFFEPIISTKSALLTRTHARLTALFPGLPRWAGTRKVKTNLDFTEARDSDWQWHQLGNIKVCTLLQTDNHTSTPPLCFYRPDALPATQPTASKHWRQQSHTISQGLC